MFVKCEVSGKLAKVALSQESRYRRHRSWSDLYPCSTLFKSLCVSVVLTKALHAVLMVNIFQVTLNTDESETSSNRENNLSTNNKCSSSRLHKHQDVTKVIQSMKRRQCVSLCKTNLRPSPHEVKFGNIFRFLQFLVHILFSNTTQRIKGGCTWCSVGFLLLLKHCFVIHRACMYHKCLPWPAYISVSEKLSFSRLAF